MENDLVKKKLIVRLANKDNHQYSMSKFTNQDNSKGGTEDPKTEKQSESSKTEANCVKPSVSARSSEHASRAPKSGIFAKRRHAEKAQSTKNLPGTEVPPKKSLILKLDLP